MVLNAKEIHNNYKKEQKWKKQLQKGRKKTKHFGHRMCASETTKSYAQQQKKGTTRQNKELIEC